jgi:hypothetical protein
MRLGIGGMMGRWSSRLVTPVEYGCTVSNVVVVEDVAN